MVDIPHVLEDGNLSSYKSCPVFTENDKNITEHISFWVGGILVCHITIAGFLLNLATLYILHINSSIYIVQNIFNQLFMALIINDNISLSFMIFETFATNLGFQTVLHEILYPYITLPITSISLTASIFLTIVIAHERYVAITYPISHRQLLISAKSRRILLSKYIFCVFLFTSVINLPKFFESELLWQCAKHNSTEISYYNTTFFMR